MIVNYNLSAQVAINTDGSLPHVSAILDVKSDTSGMLIPRMTMAQRNLINTPANGLLVYQTNGVSGFYYFDNTIWKRIGVNAGHYVGELFGGGVVFWVNHTGQHGLICSMVDLDTNQVWSNVTDVLIGNAAQSHWNGFGNSMAIVNQQGHVTSAAKLCLDYTNNDYGTGTFSDWYLPAIAELNHLGNNIYEVQKALDTDGNPATTPVTTNVYWSSSEYSGSGAWGCGVFTNFQYENNTLLKSEPLFVRAVRAF